VNRIARSYLTIVVPAVLLGLLVAAALAGRNRPHTYPPGTPEATVQAYFQALADHRPLRAHELLSPDLQDRCGLPVAADTAHLAVVRVVLDEVDTEGDRSTVRVSVTQDWGGSSPFGSDESTTRETVQLVNAGDGWRISEPPWPYFACERKG
jgi:hypothetical protein